MAEKDAVIELARFAQGLNADELNISLEGTYITGNPRVKTGKPYPAALNAAFKWTGDNNPGAYNGLKIGLRQFSTNNEAEKGEPKAFITGYLTDYFTILGLRKVSPELHDQALEDITTTGRTNIPVGLTTHFMLLTHEDKAVMTIRGLTGDNKGNLCLTGEEQMELSDDHLHQTARGGIKDEIGVEVPLKDILLLGFAIETDYAFAPWASLGQARITEDQVVAAWSAAKDRSESEALLIAPLTVVEQLRSSQTAEFLAEFVRGGSLGNDKIVPFHPTLAWRLGLLREHLTTTRG